MFCVFASLLGVILIDGLFLCTFVEMNKLTPFRGMINKSTAVIALGLLLGSASWAQKPLQGFEYAKPLAPTGKEWQSPEAYALNKLQPHATLYHFASEDKALRVLPEHSEYYRSLDGKWRFNWVANPSERPEDFYKVDYDDTAWDVVDVPMNWNVYGIDKRNGKQRYGTPIYVNQPVIFWHEVKVDDWRGGVMRTPPETWTTHKHRNEVGSYRRTFSISEANWQGRAVYLQFDGVDSFFYLWVNGKYVGFSKNSRNRAEFDITPYLNAKGENTLAVEVYRSSDGSFLEAQDMFRLPGIFRSVGLVSRPKVQIRDLQVLPDVSDNLAQGTLALKAGLSNLDKREAKGYRLDYKLYSLPLYSDEGAKLEAGAKVSSYTQVPALRTQSEATNQATLSLAEPKLWSAEAPHRYVLVASLLDKSGRVVDKVSTYVGFRKVEIKELPAEQDEFGLAGRYFLLNGKTVKLKGVNRHETHPASGHVLTKEQMHEEVMLMKRANINHVRNSHYPPDSYFYYLCDKYGIYLEDEANIESHQYYYGKESLSHVKEFEMPTTNRALEMVYANYNHPSIVIWSLGNEAGPGVNFEKSYAALKAVDSSRPVQYERNNNIVDMGSNQYPSIPWVREAVKGKYNIKYPFHISEYAHSMGNAVGGLQDYWTAIESTNFFCGAAIWDWVDQSLYNYTPEGKQYMAYGGDFGDIPNDGMFVMNGIIFADRTPKPQYYEVKKVYQNVGLSAVADKPQVIRLFNKRYYTDLSGDYDLRWVVYREGEIAQEGTLAIPQVAPRSAVELTIPYTKPSDTTKEYYLNLELKLKSDKPWAKAGYVQADEQILLQEAKLPALQLASKEQVKLSKKQGEYILGNKNFEVSYSTETGIIKSLRYGAEQLITDGNGPRLDAFRAVADNDNWAYPNWGRNGLHNLKHRVLSSEVFPNRDGSFVVSFIVESQAPNGAEIVDSRSSRFVHATGHYKIEEKTDKPFGANDFKFVTAQTWTVYPDGSLELQANITSNKPKLALARLGFELMLPKRYQRYSYYGRGPINNYSDRKTAQFVGVYNSTVAEQFVNFAKPQTMGNREEVRWVTLTDETTGRGLLVQAGRTMSASALPWSAKELLLAPHPHELPESDVTHLHLDASVNGLGGNSCGQGGPLEESRSFAHPQLFSFIIRPYAGGKVERVALSGAVAPVVSHSSSGQIAIHGRDGDKPAFLQGETYEYSLNGGKTFVPYKGSFEHLSAGEIVARSTSNKRLSSSLKFDKAQTARLEVVFASSEEAEYHPASHMVDGDPDTYWQTANRVTTAIYPHWVDFDAGRTFVMTGFRYQDMPHWYNGRAKNFVLSTSLDGKTWEEQLKGTLANTSAVQEIRLPKSVRTRYIQFKVLDSHRKVDFATGAEFVVLSE